MSLDQPACGHVRWGRSASQSTASNASAVLIGRKKSREYLIFLCVSPTLPSQPLQDSNEIFWYCWDRLLHMPDSCLHSFTSAHELSDDVASTDGPITDHATLLSNILNWLISTNNIVVYISKNNIWRLGEKIIRTVLWCVWQLCIMIHGNS